MCSNAQLFATVLLVLGAAARALAACGDGTGDAAAVADARGVIEQQCDCGSAVSRSDYLRCVSRALTERVAAGLLSTDCKVAVRKCALRSTCGRSGAVTCCRTDRTGATRCTVKPDAGRCTPPSGGTSAVGAHPSCCDVCTLAACPATTSTGTTLGSSPTTTLPPGTVTLRSLADAAGVLVGAAMRSGPLASEPEYAAILAREYNYVSPDYELMWGYVHPMPCVWNFAPIDAMVAFAEANGMRAQGTPLVWHGFAAAPLPDYVQALAPVALRSAVEDHIRTVVGRYRGRIGFWVVVNEAVEDFGNALRPTLFSNRLGPGYIANAFRWAHEADPDALLFYNDFLADGINAKSDFIYALVQDLLAQGVPIHGVGLQMHLGGFFGPPPATIRANMQRFADLGLLVHVSEMDVQIGSLPGTFEQQLEAQRTIYHDVVTDCLAVPGCHAVTTWGFTDKHTWIDLIAPGMYPLPFDAVYVPKPAYYGLRDALAGE